MKTRGLFLSALLMGAVMAGCSNEEVMNEDNQRDIKKSDNYIAVNIVAPSDVASRGEEGGYAAGNENEVKNVWFVFYNSNGGFVDAIPDELVMNDPGADDNSTIEKISTAMIVLSDPPTWPTQVVALLNTDYTKNELAAMSLNQLKADQGDFSATDYFVMSNSVYNDAQGVTITATKLNDNQICKTEALALQNPVSIPVERVLAKVEADASKAEYKGILDAENKVVKTYLDGKEVVFEPVITGMALVETNPESYILKNIDGVTGWTGWNVHTDWRSFWANSAVPANGYESLSWNAITNEGDIENYLAYCHENTSSTTTKLLVTAKFKAQGTNDYVSVIKYSGTYYTKQGLINQLADLYLGDVYYMEGSTKTNDWAKYLDIREATTENEKPWEVEAYLMDNAPEPVDATVNLADILKTINAKTMSQWTNGASYYYVDIEHFGPEADGYNVGVVRNHWYDLTIKSIMGLGTPVFNPDAEIIPDRLDEEHYYLAAEVKILKWKMVTQEVDLQ